MRVFGLGRFDLLLRGSPQLLLFTQQLGDGR